jgi:hypothetical protein
MDFSGPYRTLRSSSKSASELRHCVKLFENLAENPPAEFCMTAVVDFHYNSLRMRNDMKSNVTNRIGQVKRIT